jgi:hypothetical protein
MFSSICVHFMHIIQNTHHITNIIYDHVLIGIGYLMTFFNLDWLYLRLADLITRLKYSLNDELSSATDAVAEPHPVNCMRPDYTNGKHGPYMRFPFRY